MLSSPEDSARFSDKAFSALSQMMQETYGLYLPMEKKPLVMSRLTKRLRACRAGSLDAYLSILSESPAEQKEMLSALTTNVTSFRREAHHFQILQSLIFERAANMDRPLKIWSAGCSSGEEPLSIAITWQDYKSRQTDLRILATDVDPKILSQAQAAEYTATQLAALSQEAIERHFSPLGPDRRKASPNLTGMITYRTLNLMEPFPFSGSFDAIFCRNVAIYFDDTDQARLWRKLIDVLRPGGLLCLGHSERLDPASAKRMRPCGITAFQKPEEMT